MESEQPEALVSINIGALLNSNIACFMSFSPLMEIFISDYMSPHNDYINYLSIENVLLKRYSSSC